MATEIYFDSSSDATKSVRQLLPDSDTVAPVALYDNQADNILSRADITMEYRRTSSDDNGYNNIESYKFRTDSGMRQLTFVDWNQRSLIVSGRYRRVVQLAEQILERANLTIVVQTKPS
jgi:hypothetical protein